MFWFSSFRRQLLPGRMASQLGRDLSILGDLYVWYWWPRPKRMKQLWNVQRVSWKNHGSSSFRSLVCECCQWLDVGLYNQLHGVPVPRLRLLEWCQPCFPLRLHGALLPFLRLLAALLFSHLSADSGSRVGQGALALVFFEEIFANSCGKLENLAVPSSRWLALGICSMDFCSEWVSIRSEKLKRLRDGDGVILCHIQRNCWNNFFVLAHNWIAQTSVDLDKRQLSQELA